MYLSSFRVENVKCFADTSLEFPGGEDGSYSGWNVLLGVNGTGKSTLLQAMALALVGPTIGSELLRLPDRDKWIRQNAECAVLEALIASSEHDAVARGKTRKKPYEARMYISGNKPIQVDGVEMRQPTLAVPGAIRRSLDAGPYSGANGWFSAGYGPFRRLTGGGPEEDMKLTWQGGPASRHVSLFRESAALSRCEPWLRDLHNTANDSALKVEIRDRAAMQLLCAREIINSLLPSGVHFGTVTSRDVTFVTDADVEVELSQLSDGFRSFLSLAVDLLRQIIDANQWGGVEGSEDGAAIDTEGVVFIDEADAHLHPSWQRELGVRMCRVFPRIQFIVSTHSPFIAQAARPGGLFLVHADPEGNTVVTREEESVRGWTADQILLSPLFGLSSTRDIETDNLMSRRQQLLSKQRLKAEERAELERLTGFLRVRLTEPGDTPREREFEREMREYVESRIAKERTK